MASISKLHKYFIFATILIFSITTINAEHIIDNDFKYSLDLPEGFQIDDYTEDGMSYFFSHPNIPVNLVLKVTENKNNSESVMNTNIDKLKAVAETNTFLWNNTSCTISSFSMSLDKDYAGWAVCAPLQVQNYYISLLCYAPKDKEPDCERFIMSCLNSLCIDNNFYNTPGIITAYAFPSEGTKEVKINIHGKTIKASIDKVDEEAAQFVVDLEYSVLQLYAAHKKWQQAWERFYRMIYRDNFYRVSDVSEKLYNTFYAAAKNVNPENPDLAYAQSLLYWVQDFKYERNMEGSNSDFTNIISAVCGEGNDCDSRSMLLCVLLKSIGIETIMLISPAYSHALVATEIKAPGQTYILENTKREFLIGETTAKVTWGKIAQDQSDKSKYFPVILP